MTDQLSHPRFIVAAPLGRDGELICGLLTASGYRCEFLNSIVGLEHEDGASLLGLVLTDEALTHEGMEALRSLVQAQPAWSDLPVLLLTSGNSEPRSAALASQVRLELRSVFLLDRPVRKELLLSAVQVAYNSRLKQLEVRDAATRQTMSDEALRNSEKLAVAGRLAATMAHEVNNPLEALGNLLYLVENSTKVEEAQSLGRMARQELQRISEIVDHTLRFHRAPTKPAYTDLCELATSALALFRGKIREHQVVCRFSAHKLEAYCSGGEIRQAMVNLIGNALDAMPNGGKLTVRLFTVSVRGVKYARVTIADSGGGISKEIRTRLFTQFFTTKGSRGTGIGLWLTNDIVSRNRGFLRFRSRTRMPSGSVFTMYLPCTPAVDAQHPGSEQSGTRTKTQEAA